MAGWKGTYKHVLKLEVVGDARVGKTCLASRFGEYNFLERYHPTMGKGTGRMACRSSSAADGAARCMCACGRSIPCVYMLNGSALPAMRRVALNLALPTRLLSVCLHRVQFQGDQQRNWW